MKKRLITLLSDSSEITEYFKNSDYFDVIATSSSGSEGIALIESRRPDAVICDLMLSDLDGLSVIDKAAGLNVKTLLYSPLNSDEIIRLATARGASLYIVKPAPATLLHSRLKELFDQPQETSLSNPSSGNGKRYLSDEYRSAAELRISNIFLSAGIPPHIKGYSFLRTGVLLAMTDPSILGNITKRLYPMIADIYDTTPSKVERAIRHAIEVAWNRGRIENLNAVFGVTFYLSGDKPTNGEFIALVADRLIQEIHMGKLG
ncbi:MAG: sporulation transcription factor Spo0A [Clostridia bacterium]|nr:sporulation transcription factor Spo0A [Clostridia bacterium]